MQFNKVYNKAVPGYAISGEIDRIVFELFLWFIKDKARWVSVGWSIHIKNMICRLHTFIGTFCFLNRGRKEFMLDRSMKMINVFVGLNMTGTIRKENVRAWLSWIHDRHQSAKVISYLRECFQYGKRYLQMLSVPRHNPSYWVYGWMGEVTVRWARCRRLPTQVHRHIYKIITIR